VAEIERSFLGEAATKLSRLLSLSGLTSPKFDLNERVLPMVILGNADLPGYGDRAGVRWATGGVCAPGGVGAYAGIEAARECIVEGAWVSTNTAGVQFTTRWNTTSEASPSGATFPTFVPGLDRAPNVNVAAAVTALFQGGAAPAAVTSRTLFQNILPLGSYPALGPEWMFHMLPGSRLWIESGSLAATVYFSFWGRAF